MIKATDCTGRRASKTAGTIAAYEDRVHLLRIMADREQLAGSDILEVIDWFCGQHSRWVPSTVRQYRAALRYDLDQTEIHASRRSIAEARLSRWPQPRIGGPRKTSARKRKSLPSEQFMKLVTALCSSGKEDDLLIRSFLVFGATLFLRPIEYLQARIMGTTLIVENAKATNGRANGFSRSRDIAPMGEKATAALRTFLGELPKAVEIAGSQKKLHNRLAARLARVCKALGIARVSLYTIRHVGMATAKSWMTPVEVAAAAGHASVRTGTSHYAKRRSGWGDLRMAGKPSPDSIAAVKNTAKAFRFEPRGHTGDVSNQSGYEPIVDHTSWFSSGTLTDLADIAEIELPTSTFRSGG